MGHSMMHSHGGMERGTQGRPSPLFLPVPMAVFGVLIAFMFGMTLGMMKGSKHSMGEMSHGGSPGGWEPGKPWMKGAMRHHHHHHGGSPACCCDKPSSTAAPEDTEAGS
jgi:hypothetical protein